MSHHFNTSVMYGWKFAGSALPTTITPKIATSSGDEPSDATCQLQSTSLDGQDRVQRCLIVKPKGQYARSILLLLLDYKVH